MAVVITATNAYDNLGQPKTFEAIRDHITGELARVERMGTPAHALVVTIVQAEACPGVHEP